MKKKNKFKRENVCVYLKDVKQNYEDKCKKRKTWKTKENN